VTEQRHFARDYERHVTYLLGQYTRDRAMELAVGDAYEQFGNIEADIVIGAGLKEGDTILDMGCGSGRLSSVLSKRFKSLRYTGTDVVDELLAYAKEKSSPDYVFIKHLSLSVPINDGELDFFCAFSVFTHLYHDETFVYLQDVHRAMKPGGTIVFSFLEAAEEAHWPVFENQIRIRREAIDVPLVMFLERPMIEMFARRIGLQILRYQFGPPLGQSLVVMRRP
jgi:ubiquinone/menaquinone biosynthesis C-methylase UbiE